MFPDAEHKHHHHPRPVPPINTGCDHEPHGNGSHELPSVVTPEDFTDRNTHQEATKAIMLLEAGLVKGKPQASAKGSFVEIVIQQVLNGRVSVIVKQRYMDAGWKEVVITQLDNVSSKVAIYFP